MESYEGSFCIVFRATSFYATCAVELQLNFFPDQSLYIYFSYHPIELITLLHNIFYILEKVSQMYI